MRSFNKIMLIGHLAADPEVKLTKNGKKFAYFSIATNRDWKTSENEKESSTDFHRVIAWGKVAEIVEKYLKKGRPVFISGRLGNRTYNGKDGKKRYVSEVTLDDMNFLWTKKSETGESTVEFEEAIKTS